MFCWAFTEAHQMLVTSTWAVMDLAVAISQYTSIYHAYLDGTTLVCNLVPAYWKPLAELMDGLSRDTGFDFLANMYVRVAKWHSLQPSSSLWCTSNTWYVPCGISVSQDQALMSDVWFVHPSRPSCDNYRADAYASSLDDAFGSIVWTHSCTSMSVAHRFSVQEIHGCTFPCVLLCASVYRCVPVCTLLRMFTQIVCYIGTSPLGIATGLRCTRTTKTVSSCKLRAPRDGTCECNAPWIANALINRKRAHGYTSWFDREAFQGVLFWFKPLKHAQELT